MSSSPFYLSDEASLQDLFHRMESPAKEECELYRHLNSVQCFTDRIFVVYKPSGLTADRQHRAPQILTQVKVTGFRANSKTGAEIDLLDMTSRQIMTVGYIPKRLFDYEAFVCVPPKQRLNWDAQNVGGIIRRSMAFHMLIKVRGKADFYSAGVTAVETPARFRELFPDTSLMLSN